MPKISELHKKHLKQDIYIIGTGPSLRLFPLDYLKGKITIGLNQAYKLFPHCTYNLTIHPYLIPLNRSQWLSKWVTKRKISDESWKLHLKNENDKYFYLFNNNNDPLDTSFLTPSLRPSASLYVGCGIQTGAIHLAAIMGACNAFLIACDMGLTAGEHHAIDQHVEPHQFHLNQVYEEYFYYTYKVAELIKKFYGMNTLNLSAGFGIPHHFEKQYRKALLEKRLEPLPKPRIIEKNVRTTPLIRDFF